MATVMATVLPDKTTVAGLVVRLERAAMETGYALNALEQASTELGLAWPREGIKSDVSADEPESSPSLYERLEMAVAKAERNLARLNNQTSLLGNTLGLTDTSTKVG